MSHIAKSNLTASSTLMHIGWPTQANRHSKKDPRLYVSAAGHYYTDSTVEKFFDGLSGFMTCGLGHSVPAITKRLLSKVKTLDYFLLPFNMGMRSRFLLPSQSLNLPAGLNFEFSFTASGSESFGHSTTKGGPAHIGS